MRETKGDVKLMCYDVDLNLQIVTIANSEPGYREVKTLHRKSDVNF